MRQKIIAGNWKMNTSLNDGIDLAKELNRKLRDFCLSHETQVILAVPFTHINNVLRNVIEKIPVAAQNCSQFDNGAYTGEISATMLANMEVKYVIIGHSERRQFFGDTNQVINQKLTKCYENGLIPILCCGETLEEREKQNHFKLVETQIIEALKDIEANNLKTTVIAYEPVWAIGTGKTATPQQAQEMHSHIRKIIEKLYDAEIANNITILYGGSVNAQNSSELFAQNDIDGGLVGGASLKVDDFVTIVNSI